MDSNELKTRLEQHKMWLNKNLIGNYKLSSYLENRYYVFDTGFVVSAFNPCGTLRKTPKILKRRKSKNGYLSVVVSGKNKLIHRAVADAFIGSVKNKIVHHKNGIRFHNCSSNLEITSSSLNNKHGHKTRKQLNKKIITEMIRYYRQGASDERKNSKNGK